MEVIKDLKRVINQALGKENMFGFKTTLANQMNLLFCIIGNVYYTDKIHRKTKLAWFCGVYSICSVFGVSIALSLMYARLTDVLLLIYMGFGMLFILMEVFVKPAIAVFWYRSEIERMIFLADEILMKKPATNGKLKDALDAKEITKNVIVALAISIALYVSLTTIDMILFYEEEKVKNYMYYLSPLPGISQFGSLTFYVVYSVLLSCFSLCGFIVVIVHRVFAIPWVVVSHNETKRIMNELNSLSEDVDINIDTFKSIEPKFRYVMRKCIYDINNLNRFVTSFRGFYETSASFILPILLYIEVAHALIAISPGFPFVIRLREVFVFLIAIQEVYVICWVGATLEQIASDLSFAVYSTPWYWLKSIRKDVYILLCQTQAEINPRALRVYPLTLATFLRFCNVINSTVNVFRAYTQK